MEPFKNLIFDIGDVIIDIDYQVTIREFQKLATVDFSQVVSYSHQNKIFDLFEVGKITAAQFRDQLRPFLKPNIPDDAIDKAWNAIMIAFPVYKFDMLKELKTRYHTFALSNINEIHVATLNRIALTKLGNPDFESFFHHAYYSNEIGHRKPEKEIFQFILEMENLNPDQTFFVDDKKENVDAAKTLGIHAYQLTDRNKLTDLLKDLKII